MRAELERVLRENSIPCSDSCLAKLMHYYQLLVAENKKTNLTALTTPADYIFKHVLDSLLPAKYFAFGGAGLLDIGSGAGLPGLPLKMLLPELKLTLLEAVGKKVEFLKACCRELDIEAEIIWGRAEDLGRSPRRETFSVAVTRAVAALGVVCEYSLPLLASGGHCVALKGSKGEEETITAVNCIALLGGSLTAIHRYNLPTGEERSLIIIQKTSPTPAKYPRRAGIPSKRPL